MTHIPSQENKNYYPEFEGGQVLTEGDLNQIVYYSDKSNRETRSRLIGSGIVCGFHVSVGQSGEIIVSQGLGMTSDGFMVNQSEDKIYTHCKKLEDFPVKYFHVNKQDEGENPWEENPFITIWELNSEGEGKQLGEDTGDLGNVYQDYSVVIFLEQVVDDKEKCLDDCNSVARKWTLKQRTFLIKNQQNIEEGEVPQEMVYLDDIFKVGYGGNSLNDLFKGKYELTTPKIRQFGYNGDGQISFSNMRSLEVFHNNFFEVCKEAISGISEALSGVHKTFSTVLTSSIFHHFTKVDLVSHFDGVEEALLNHLEKNEYGQQYFYSFLKDVILAYDEFRTAAFDLMDDCDEGRMRFPYFLSLGEAVVEPCRGSAFRSEFTQPSIYNGNKQRVKEVKMLYARLRFLVHHATNSEGVETLSHFDVPSIASSGVFQRMDTKIVPSQKQPSPLSERAIPYYFVNGKVQELKAQWSHEKWRKCNAASIPNYFTTDTKDLTFHLEHNDFYRVEGHLGRGYKGVMSAIDDQRSAYNLPFGLVGVKLGEVFDSEGFELRHYAEMLGIMNAELMCVLCEKLKPTLLGYSNFFIRSNTARIARWREVLKLMIAGVDINTSDIPEFNNEDKAFVKLLTACKDSPNFMNTDGDPLFFAYLFRNEVVQPPFGESALPIFYQFMQALVNLVNELEKEDCTFDFDISKLETFLEEFERFKNLDIDVEDISRHCDITKYRNLKNRIDCYKKEFLFHNFARKHPGLVHDGGVPKGGTFVVVYAEREELRSFLVERGSPKNIELYQNLTNQDRRIPFISNISDQRIVVADFYLPYNCCTDAPPIATLVERPKPVVYLEKTVFCSGEDDRKQIFVYPQGGEILAPNNDSIVKDETDGNYYFIPANVPGLEGTEDPQKIKIVYEVDGAQADVTVTVFPEVDAQFDGLQQLYCLSREINADGNQQSITVQLNPVSGNIDGSAFYLKVGNQQRQRLESNSFTIDPSFFVEGEDNVVIEVEHQVIGKSARCPNSATQRSVVALMPNADIREIVYNGEAYPAGTSHICIANDFDEVQLVAQETGGIFTANVSEVGEGGTYKVEFPDGSVEKEIEVTFTHTIEKVHLLDGEEVGTCRGENKINVLFKLQQNTDFTGIEQVYCIESDPKLGFEVELVLEDPSVEGLFSVNGENIEGNIIRLDANLIPEDEDMATVSIAFTAFGSDDNSICSGTTTKTIDLLRKPNASFNIVDEGEVLILRLDDNTSAEGRFIVEANGESFDNPDIISKVVLPLEGQRIFRLDFTPIFQVFDEQFGEGEIQSANVTITYLISLEEGCPNSFTSETFQVFRSGGFEVIPTPETPSALESVTSTLSTSFSAVIEGAENTRSASLTQYRRGLNEFFNILSISEKDIETEGSEAKLFERIYADMEAFKTNDIKFNSRGATSRIVLRAMSQIAEEKQNTLERMKVLVEVING